MLKDSEAAPDGVWDRADGPTAAGITVISETGILEIGGADDSSIQSITIDGKRSTAGAARPFPFFVSKLQ